MKLEELTEGTLKFNDKAEWAEVMKSKGADEFLKEKEFNVDLIYAVGGKGTSLKGTWNEKTGKGIMYQGAKGVGMKFDKRRRTFNKVKL